MLECYNEYSEGFGDGEFNMRDEIMGEIREILDNIYKNGELEASLAILEKMSGYKK